MQHICIYILDSCALSLQERLRYGLSGQMTDFWLYGCLSNLYEISTQGMCALSDSVPVTGLRHAALQVCVKFVSSVLVCCSLLPEGEGVLVPSTCSAKTSTSGNDEVAGQCFALPFGHPSSRHRAQLTELRILIDRFARSQPGNPALQ